MAVILGMNQTLCTGVRERRHVTLMALHVLKVYHTQHLAKLLYSWETLPTITTLLNWLFGIYGSFFSHDYRVRHFSS